jgi:hypothetical protein
MFGFSSFSEAPFSSLVAAGDVWNEIRIVDDTWTQVDVQDDTPLPSLRLNFLTGTYEVVLTLVDYDQLWQSASTNSNSWVEV